jgi:nitronate monooxygenase
MRLQTPLTRLLHIDHPIVQAPIGSASTPELAAAVSNAGGLGMLSLTWRSLDEARDLIRRTRTLTDRPFAINLILHWDPWERLAIAIEERVPVISLFWGDPAPCIAAIREAGLIACHTVGSANEATAAIEAEAQIIVTQGWEAGGHVWGDVATMPLVPAVVDVAGETPVVAAGGIGDGRGVAAALCLGASGAWLGTRFLLAEETPLHPRYRELLTRAVSSDAVHTYLFDHGWPGSPLRTLRNDTLAQWEAAGRPPTGIRPGEGESIAIRGDGSEIVRYADDIPMTDTTGDIDAMVHYAGQSVGIVRETLPAATIVHRIVDETIEALACAGTMVATSPGEEQGQ